MFGRNLLPERWSQQVAVKHWYLCAELCSVAA